MLKYPLIVANKRMKKNHIYQAIYFKQKINHMKTGYGALQEWGHISVSNPLAKLLRVIIALSLIFFAQNPLIYVIPNWKKCFGH